MRTHARSVSAEMHSSFMALRNECSMNIHRPVRGKALSDDARANVARVVEIWADCRERYGDSRECTKHGRILMAGRQSGDLYLASRFFALNNILDDVFEDQRRYDAELNRQAQRRDAGARCCGGGRGTGGRG